MRAGVTSCGCKESSLGIIKSGPIKIPADEPKSSGLGRITSGGLINSAECNGEDQVAKGEPSGMSEKR